MQTRRATLFKSLQLSIRATQVPQATGVFEKRSSHELRRRFSLARVCLLTLAGVGMGLLNQPNTASALDLQSVFRSVGASDDSFCPDCPPDNVGITSENAGLFDERARVPYARASQDTTVGANSISGRGSAGAGGSEVGHGSSFLRVDFTVPTHQQIQISGQLINGGARVRFESPTETIFSVIGSNVEVMGIPTPTLFDQLFDLAPGTLYTFSATAAASGSDGSSAVWQTSLVTIPEPGTGLLLALGLLLLGRKRA